VRELFETLESRIYEVIQELHSDPTYKIWDRDIDTEPKIVQLFKDAEWTLEEYRAEVKARVTLWEKIEKTYYQLTRPFVEVWFRIHMRIKWGKGWDKFKQRPSAQDDKDLGE